MENNQENENETFEYSPEDVVIDPYSCDLNLVVDKECLLAYPLSSEGFCSMWAGCRSTFGVNNGKVAFEVHLEDYCECTDLPKDDPEPYLIRIGWSLNRSCLQLGESKFSFGYCSNGKKCTNKQFEDYGESFEKGDSIGCYLDFDSDKDNLIISFSKNGLDLGPAFKINKKEISNYSTKELNESNLVLFPHVLSKNVVFEMNFGQRVSLIGDEPFAPIKSGFELIQKLPLDKRFSNEAKSKSKKECSVIFMIGLPGSGKSKWVSEYVKKNLKKNFYVIGVSSILKRMKVLGLKKKLNTNQSGEFVSLNSVNSASGSKIQAELLDKVLKCMNLLCEIASQSYRNIIIDQCNVYKSTRRRKLKLFEEFNKKAIVLIPSDEVYIERLNLVQKEDGKEIPTNLINDMKNDNEFNSIEYVELEENEALKLVEFYNSQAQTDRLNLLLERRAKKNEEKRRALGINPVLLLRPVYRPNFPYSPGISSQFYSQQRFPRFGVAAAANLRRPVNPAYMSQYARPGQRYPVDYRQQMMYSGYGVVQTQWAPALPVGPQQVLLMQGQPYPGYSQYTSQTQVQNSWDPVMSTNLSQTISSSVYYNQNSNNNNNENK